MINPKSGLTVYYIKSVSVDASIPEQWRFIVKGS